MAELLSPAGNFEKLKAAVRYGADAVYCAGQCFGMRASAGNFTPEELIEASQYLHGRGRRLYLTVNTMPHDSEYPRLREYLTFLREVHPDGLIAADLGVMAEIRDILPDAELHVSTQASVVSAAACRAYAALGASRIVLARELSLDQIRAIRENLPPEIALEAFIHGSMCISYSGRCMLSYALTGRDANHGACTQPCRWNYAIVEEKRPAEPMPIESGPEGTFILSSKDMCLIEHVPELVEAGIDSFKIEGRMKSAYYTAVVTNAYRMALDAYAADPAAYRYDPAWLRELESVSHREYCTGYYFDDPAVTDHRATVPGYLREKAYLATVRDYDPATGIATFIQ
ncbi:MAG: U32 family peptidase, partial [Clostridia bacterium]|nr:U32 family peptidase [Clostridia bacterium]